MAEKTKPVAIVKWLMEAKNWFDAYWNGVNNLLRSKSVGKLNKRQSPVINPTIPEIYRNVLNEIVFRLKKYGERENSTKNSKNESEYVNNPSSDHMSL